MIREQFHLTDLNILQNPGEGHSTQLLSKQVDFKILEFLLASRHMAGLGKSWHVPRMVDREALSYPLVLRLLLPSRKSQS